MRASAEAVGGLEVWAALLSFLEAVCAGLAPSQALLLDTAHMEPSLVAEVPGLLCPQVPFAQHVVTGPQATLE